MSVSAVNNTLNILSITSGGGGGHLQAAKAERAKILARDPKANIVEVDMMKDILGERMGKMMTTKWDEAQKKEDVKKQVRLFKARPIADVIFGMRIFFKVFNYLRTHNIDEIVDTQIMGTKMIVRAARLANFLFHKNIRIKKIMTDLPTNESQHFFGPIGRLTKKDKAIFELHTVKPMVDNEARFWKEQTGLTFVDGKSGQVIYDTPPIRPAFVKLQNTPKVTTDIKLQVKINHPEELELISKALGRNDIATTEANGKKTISLDVQRHDNVTFLMLGSQAAEQATLDYVKNMIKAVKSKNPHQTHHLFLTCNRHTPGEETLLKRVVEEIAKEPNFPKNLKIVPMAFQDDDELAPIMHRANQTITRSGGLTAMELLAVARGQIYVHTATHCVRLECRKQPNGEKVSDKLLIPTYEEMLAGNPLWEGGNFKYLEAAKGARLINTDLLERSLFRPEPPKPMSWKKGKVKKIHMGLHQVPLAQGIAVA